MSAKKIDELFRSKLEGHAGVPSPDAWARLQSKMTPAEEKKVGVWWYVAAAIPLLLVAGWFLFLPGNGESTTSGTLAEKETKTNVSAEKENSDADTQLADVTVPTQKQPLDTAQEPAKATETKSAQPKKAVAKADTRKKTQKPVQPADTQIASADQNKQTQMETLAAIEDINKVKEISEEADPLGSLELAEGNLVAIVEEPVETPEVKITFIADEDDKFLDPVRELIASELPKEKKNGFGKLVASARSFSNRDILSELRDSKDDLFNGGMKRGNVRNEKGQ